MTPEEITAMAKEAWGDGWFPALHIFSDEFERFAALVAEKAAAKEREACAQVCETLARWGNQAVDGPSAKGCAVAIRARGQKGGV